MQQNPKAWDALGSKWLCVAGKTLKGKKPRKGNGHGLLINGKRPEFVVMYG
jgi:hypothetical protein